MFICGFTSKWYGTREGSEGRRVYLPSNLKIYLKKCKDTFSQLCLLYNAMLTNMIIFWQIMYAICWEKYNICCMENKNHTLCVHVKHKSKSFTI